MNALAPSGKNTNALMTTTAANAGSGQFLTFMLGGEVFALGILNIKEIIQYGDVTEVPMMPSFIRGVINLRGRVVPVVDLAARFSRGNTTISRRTSIVILEMNSNDESDTQNIGIVVDAVNEVIDIAAGDIEPPPSFGAKIRPDFICGMAKKDGRFIIVLNLNQIVSFDEMQTLGQSTHQTETVNT